MDTNDRCPLCGGPNQCGASAGAAECWCFSVVIPQDVLDQVPPEQRNRSCICARCASREGGNALAGNGHERGDEPA